MDLNSWIYLFLGVFLIITGLVAVGLFTLSAVVMNVVHFVGIVAGVLMLVYVVKGFVK